jgi:hypothetical protein
MPRKWVGYLFCLVALLVATDWVMAQSQGTPGAQVVRGRGDRMERQLVYMPTSGTGGGRVQNGSGIMVFDVRNHFRLVKRIPSRGPTRPGRIRTGMKSKAWR